MGFQITAGLAMLILSTQVAAQAAAYAQCGGNEWYSQCVPGAAATTKTTSTTTKPATTIKTSTTSKATTTTQAPGGGGGGIVTPTKVTTTFPSATGETMLPSATVISGVFDGKMARWHRTSADVCQGQTETGEKDTIFILEDGATLANVIIGKNQAEGVHCRGTCTLINVWHEEVCEDAMTFKQASGTSYVIGGGARNADDKIMQFNGRGTVSVKYFYADNFGKVMRHCGNCSGNGGPRISTFEGIVAKGGGVVVGINTNYGDKASLADSCITGGTKYGDMYTGVTSGEPKKIGPCPDSTFCPQSNVVTSC
ncbi:hypothetical protein IFR05_011117 [Cadophora sp. M221]|nr:hypothetical protein IFR05_011117 [Cadophora sp. M221]